jgi:hypothetical protein
VLSIFTVGIRGVVRGDAVAVQTRGQGARGVGGVCVAGGRLTSAEGEGRRADGDAILAVVDAPTVGEYVDVGALGTELAIALSRGDMCQRRCVGEGHADGDTMCDRWEAGGRGGWSFGFSRSRDGAAGGRRRLTLAKYLQTVSAELPMS